MRQLRLIAAAMARETTRVLTEADRDAAGNLRAIWEREKRERKFTQEDVADAMGVTQGAVSQWLNADVPLGIKAVFGFARFLNCQPVDIRPELSGLGFSSGDLSDEAVKLALYWQEHLPAEAKDAAARLIYSYPPSRDRPEEKPPAVASR